MKLCQEEKLELSKERIISIFKEIAEKQTKIKTILTIQSFVNALKQIASDLNMTYDDLIVHFCRPQS